MKQFLFNHYGSIITILIALFVMVKAKYDVSKEIKENAKWWEENTKLFVDKDGHLVWTWSEKYISNKQKERFN